MRSDIWIIRDIRRSGVFGSAFDLKIPYLCDYMSNGEPITKGSVHYKQNGGDIDIGYIKQGNNIIIEKIDYHVNNFRRLMI